MDVESGRVNGTVARVIHIECDIPKDTPIYGGKELSLVMTLQLDDQWNVTISCHCISITKENEKQGSHFQSKDVVKAYYVPLRNKTKLQMFAKLINSVFDKMADVIQMTQYETPAG